MFHECKNTQKLIKAYSDCQLIAFAVSRLGYLVLPKAFQKNASHPFGFFNAR